MNLLNCLKSKRLARFLLVLILTLSFTIKSYSQEVQRVRINFTAPDNSVRQLLLAFTPDNSATDDFDYGWDAVNWNSYPNDLNWVINGYNCIIQAVGAFDYNKSYPLHLLIGDTGAINIALYSLENFEETIDVFIYDSFTDTFHSINDDSYNKTLDEGEYSDRYYITFTNNIQQIASLSNNSYDKDNLNVRYLRNTKELFVNSVVANKIHKIEVYTITGQLLSNYNAEGQKDFKTKLIINGSKVVIVKITTDNGTTVKKLII